MLTPTSVTPAPGPLADLVADVRRGLGAAPRWLPPRWFYDALGSSLFEAICQLPWYPVTRAENALLDEHAAALAAAPQGGGASGWGLVVELGGGSGEKLARLGPHLVGHDPALPVHCVDVSPLALDLARKTLGRIEHLRVVGHLATYHDGFAAALAHRDGGPALVLFLGSNIGNFTADESRDFLVGLRARMRPGDVLLLGTDLIKPEAELVAAYDDPLGVTAAFNKNLLVRLDRELGADFALDGFRHVARWDAARSRVEMHLESVRAQTVRIPAAELVVELAAGERIHTESSYKFTPDGVRDLARRGGFATERQWTGGGFALSRLVAD